MLESRRLRVLCEVARHGSFSAAADALGYTQPAVSRQIAALPAGVGTGRGRRGSFPAAADALGYTQPAVSRQIAALEAEVGTVLVRRVPQGAVLTDAGRLLSERGAAVLSYLQDMEEELRALLGLEAVTLRLATFASAAGSIVPRAVALFRDRHPAVQLAVEMYDPDESIPRLRAGEFDLALSHDPRGDPEREGQADDLV